MNTQEAINNFLDAKQGISPRTLDQYRQVLQRLATECPELPRSPEPLRRALGKEPTPWTKDACWRIWTVLYRWCKKEYGAINAMERVERPRRPVIEIRALDQGELALVLASAESLQGRALLALGLDSGVRASEFGKITIGDIGTESVWIWGKGNKRVRVPVSPETIFLLNSLAATIKNASPRTLLFTDSRGRPLSRFTAYRIVRSCFDRAGITGPKRGPHCLRHSLGRNYIEDGGDPFSLKRIMRHNSIATTQKYVNLAMRTVIDQHNIHSPVRRALQGAQGVLINREVDEILGR